MKKNREINTLGFVVIMAAFVAFALLTAALDSFWLGLAIVLLPFIALAIYAWKVPERRPQIVAIFNFVKTKGVELLTEEQRVTKAIESEKNPVSQFQQLYAIGSRSEINLADTHLVRWC